MKNFKIILYILVLLIISYLYSQPRYFWFFPTLPFFYPNSKNESKEVARIQLTASPELTQLFYETDWSVANAFHRILKNESKSTLKKTILHPKVLFPIVFFKYGINRARPWQVNQSIKKLPSKTAMTPSFPAGHAFQAYYLAKYYSKKYPELKNQLWDLARKCDECRIAAGLHYPSDGKFSLKLVNVLY